MSCVPPLSWVLVVAVPLDWEAVPHCLGAKNLLNGVAWDSGLGCCDSGGYFGATAQIPDTG